ncbi:MAG: hypothetical protein QNL01_03105 [Akkermansiaceae bacterium]
MEKQEYYVGSYRKAFGPGKDLPIPVAGTKVKNVGDFFLNARRMLLSVSGLGPPTLIAATS